MTVVGVIDSSWTDFLVSIFHYRHSKVDAQQGSGQTTLTIREYPQLTGPTGITESPQQVVADFKAQAAQIPAESWMEKLLDAANTKEGIVGVVKTWTNGRIQLGEGFDLPQSWLLTWGGASNQHTHTYKEHVSRELSGAVLTLEENLFILFMNFLNLMSFEL